MWRGVETGTLRQGADLLEMQSGCDRGDVDRLLSQKRCCWWRKSKRDAAEAGPLAGHDCGLPSCRRGRSCRWLGASRRRPSV